MVGVGVGVMMWGARGQGGERGRVEGFQFCGFCGRVDTTRNLKKFGRFLNFRRR